MTEHDSRSHPPGEFNAAPGPIGFELGVGRLGLQLSAAIAQQAMEIHTYQQVRINELEQTVTRQAERIDDSEARIQAAEEKAEAFQEEAEIDPVSYVYARRAFQRKAEESLGRLHGPEWRREGDINAVAFLYIDIEQFKRINTHHTHSGGDIALGLLGQAMHLIGRAEDDFPGRLSGDEFAEWLTFNDPDKVTETVAAVRERLRATFNKLLEHEQGVPDFVGLSIGVSVALRNGPYKSYDQLCHEADVDMFRDKEERKDQGKYGR